MANRYIASLVIAVKYGAAGVTEPPHPVPLPRVEHETGSAMAAGTRSILLQCRILLEQGEIDGWRRVVRTAARGERRRKDPVRGLYIVLEPVELGVGRSRLRCPVKYLRFRELLRGLFWTQNWSGTVNSPEFYRFGVFKGSARDALMPMQSVANISGQ